MKDEKKWRRGNFQLSSILRVSEKKKTHFPVREFPYLLKKNGEEREGKGEEKWKTEKM